MIKYGLMGKAQLQVTYSKNSPSVLSGSTWVVSQRDIKTEKHTTVFSNILLSLWFKSSLCAALLGAKSALYSLLEEQGGYSHKCFQGFVLPDGSEYKIYFFSNEGSKWNFVSYHPRAKSPSPFCFKTSFIIWFFYKEQGKKDHRCLWRALTKCSLK